MAGLPRRNYLGGIPSRAHHTSTGPSNGSLPTRRGVLTEVQVRLYDVRPGSLDAFAREWREQLVPLREHFGFTVLGGWPVEDTGQFLWLLGYDGADGFATANDRYYASPERKATEPNPARHITTVRAWMVETP